MWTNLLTPGPSPNWRGEVGSVEEMAFPARPVFTPFVVVVGGKYFLPVPGCLLFGQECLLQETIFYCA
jgi:hypothetical protein